MVYLDVEEKTKGGWEWECLFNLLLKSFKVGERVEGKPFFFFLFSFFKMIRNTYMQKQILSELV